MASPEATDSTTDTSSSESVVSSEEQSESYDESSSVESVVEEATTKASSTPEPLHDETLEAKPLGIVSTEDKETVSFSPAVDLVVEKNGHRQYISPTGTVAVNQWTYSPATGNWYYSDQAGNIVKEILWQNQAQYYYESTRRITDVLVTVNDRRYYFEPQAWSGVMAKNKWSYHSALNNWYYSD
ncbi:hypothetical protein NHG32_09090, partial [Aerococcaceae bacterium NML191219]|nr:hypothetical protein [Aerococcaceae bacterium NML191219]